MRRKFYVLSFLLFLFVSGILAIAVYFYFLFTQFNPQGKATANCIKEEILAKPNGVDMIVTAHKTNCRRNKNYSTFYVYLHKQGVVDKADFLIFKYADEPDAPAPAVEWNKDILLISTGDVFHIAEQVSSKDGITIHYTLGKEDDEWVKGNPERWARVEIAAFLFLMMILLVISSYKVIKLMRHLRAHQGNSS
jgi:hypothetical protein